MALYELGGMSTHLKVIAPTVPLYLAPTLNHQNYAKKLAKRGGKGRGEFWK